MRLPVDCSLALVALISLAGCASGAADVASVPTQATNGPAADYPMVIGEPFTVGDKTYTPQDRLNYDAVGYALLGSDSTGPASAAHKTLPIPSYVEVTDLDSGRTALLRVDTRGPMRNDALVELSPAAVARLGIAASGLSAVRVRRVNPPEQERAVLRAGEQATLRMETPKALLKVLKRKLGKQQAAPLAATPKPAPILPIDPDVPAQAQTAPVQTAPVQTAPVQSAQAKAPPVAKASSDRKAETAPAIQARPAVSPSSDRLIVQVGAFSTQSRAQKAAKPLGATITKPGRLWVVRLGPFPSTVAADAGLEKARAAGYKDAIVRRLD